MASVVGSKASTAVTSARITPSRSRRVTGAPSSAAKTSATSSGARPGGLAAGEGAGGPDRAVEALGEGGEAEAAFQLGDIAVGELLQGVGRPGLAPVGGDAVADLGEGDRRRRVDAVEAEGGDAAVGELDEVGLLARLGLERGVAEGGVLGDAAARLGVERDVAELERRLGGDLLEGRAAGDEVLDVGGLVEDLRAGGIEGAFLGEVGLRLLEGDGLRRHDGVDAVERRAERRGDRADDPRLGGAEDGVARGGGERVGGDDALVHVGGREAALGGELVEVGLAGVDPRLGRGRLRLATEADAVERAPLGGLEMVDVGLVGGAEFVLGDLDAGGEARGRHAGVAHLPRLGAGVAVGGVGLVLGRELGVAGLGDRRRQEARVEAEPVEAAALAEEGEDRLRLGVGHGGGRLHAAGEEVARRLPAEERLEVGGTEARALEGGDVGLGAELAVRALEGGGGGHLGAYGLVAGGEAEAHRLVVEGGVVDEAGEHHAVDAVLARLGHGERAAGLLLQGAELLLHGADIVLGGDRDVADAGDAVARYGAAGVDAEAGEADHEGGEKRVDQHAGASVAEGSEHARRSPNDPWRKGGTALTRWAAGWQGRRRGGAKTGGCGVLFDAQRMHRACTTRMPGDVQGRLTSVG